MNTYENVCRMGAVTNLKKDQIVIEKRFLVATLQEQ